MCKSEKTQKSLRKGGHVMEFEIEIGKTERHILRFQYTKLRNRVDIFVDGVQVIRKIYRIWIPASYRYELNVGQDERHNVIIDTTIKRTAAKFQNPSCIVSVDDNVIGQY